jgi:Holliday junction resolvase RusA-like endonuclease
MTQLKIKDSITLTFDNIRPISKQHSWGHKAFFDKRTGKPRNLVFQKTEYRDLKTQIQLIAKAQCGLLGWKIPDKKAKLAVASVVYWPRKLRGCDVADNMLGIFYDALEGIAYHNDRQFEEAHVKRIKTDDTMKIVITILEPEGE